MGFSLTIIDNGTGREYSDGHKFYGYASYEEVKESFDILCGFIREQWEKECAILTTNDEIYEIFFCAAVGTNQLVLNASEFSTWAKEYISDYRKYRGFRFSLETYIEALTNSPNNKILEWY